MLLAPFLSMGLATVGYKQEFFQGLGDGVFFCGLTDLLVGDALVMVPHGLAANLLLAPAPAYPPMCSYLLWYYL